MWSRDRGENEERKKHNWFDSHFSTTWLGFDYTFVHQSCWTKEHGHLTRRVRKSSNDKHFYIRKRHEWVFILNMALTLSLKSEIYKRHASIKKDMDHTVYIETLNVW